jgi:phosphoglycerate dehydrogenase-like enzyme
MRIVNSHVWLNLGDELPKDDAEQLRHEFPNVTFSVDLRPEAHSSVDIVFTRSKLPDETTAQLPSLKWIHTTYGGGLSFLTPYVAGKGIVVTCSRGVQAQPLSEYAEACVLALAKKFPLLSDLKRARRWDETLALDTLSGKVVGLLGLGAVGSAVAQRLHSQGMTVRAIRRNVNKVPPYVESVCGMEGLDGILAAADFLIVGLPPIPGKQSLIGERQLRSMKPTAHLINLVTRGIVDDDALARALREGWIAGAACNVFGTNPLPSGSPLWDAPNLIISPNIAQTDPQRWSKLRNVFTENLKRYLQGEPLANRVDGQGAY